MADLRKTVTLYLYLPKAQKVVLSRRGKLERRAGLLQATVHGQIETGEIAQLAMKREFEEEVKGDFHQLTNICNLGDAKVGITVPEHTFYQTAMFPDDNLKDLKPTQEVSEFVLVSENEVDRIIPYSKAKDKPENYFFNNMVMYDDEIKILKRVFKKYSSV